MNESVVVFFVFFICITFVLIHGSIADAWVDGLKFMGVSYGYKKSVSKRSISPKMPICRCSYLELELIYVREIICRQGSCRRDPQSLVVHLTYCNGPVAINRLYVDNMISSLANGANAWC